MSLADVAQAKRATLVLAEATNMKRSLLRLTGAIAIFVLLAPSRPFAAPTPGLSYDEIVRIVINATPPPPGSFQTDLAALSAPAAAASPTPAPKKRGFSLGNIASAVLTGGVDGAAGALAGDAASNAIGNAMDAQLGAQFGALAASMRGFLTPHLLRYSYYNGWERIDDVTAQNATIRKCDAGQVITLDLAKKTYAIVDPNSEAAMTAAKPSAPEPRKARGPAAGAPSAPGTANFDFSATTKLLGSQRIENVPTVGYDSTAAVAVTNATGSCKDGSFAIKTTAYYSALNRPSAASCPVRRAPIPQNATDMMTPPQSSGGCRPTFTNHQSGPTVPTAKLPLYSLVTMNAGGGASPAPAASGTPSMIGFLTERGNLKTLDATAATLFDIPAGFVKTP